MVTGALKLFFRELPEPLVPYGLFDAFIEAVSKCLPWASPGYGGGGGRGGRVTMSDHCGFPQSCRTPRSRSGGWLSWCRACPPPTMPPSATSWLTSAGKGRAAPRVGAAGGVGFELPHGWVGYGVTWGGGIRWPWYAKGGRERISACQSDGALAHRPPGVTEGGRGLDGVHGTTPQPCTSPG